MRKATDARFALELSYLEIYNETIRDLLDESGVESAQTGGLALRQDARNGATVCGLTWHAPDAASDVLEMLERGNARRAVGATGANAASSRSHAVLQIRLRRSARAAGVEEEQRQSTLTLIDLAGRARVRDTDPAALNEGANINRSLLALANCINALAKGGAGAHVPYRDSKLTRLLRDALGGNCRTAIIATVSPAALSAEDTHNTLKYAHRAKEIKVKATANKVSVKHHVSKYRDIIAGLQGEVASWKAKFEKMQARLAAAEAGAKREKADAEDADEGARAAELYAEIDASFSRRATAEEQLAQLRAEGAAAGEDAAAGKKRKELEAEIEAQLEAAEAEEGVLHASLRKLKSTEKRALLQQEIRCRTLQLELADAPDSSPRARPPPPPRRAAAAPVVAAPAAPAARRPRRRAGRLAPAAAAPAAAAASPARTPLAPSPPPRRAAGRAAPTRSAPSRRRLADRAGAPEKSSIGGVGWVLEAPPTSPVAALPAAAAPRRRPRLRPRRSCRVRPPSSAVRRRCRRRTAWDRRTWRWRGRRRRVEPRLNVAAAAARGPRCVGAELARPGARGQGLAPRKQARTPPPRRRSATRSRRRSRGSRRGWRRRPRRRPRRRRRGPPKGSASKIKTPKHRITEVWGR